MPCAIPNLKKFERQKSSVQRTSSITNDQAHQHMTCNLCTLSSMLTNGMRPRGSLAWGYLVQSPQRDVVWQNLMESHIQNGQRDVICKISWNPTFKMGGANSMVWQNSVRAYAKHLLPNLDDITSLVMKLVRTEVAAALWATVHAMKFLSAT